MRIFANKSLWKKILIVIALLTSVSFVNPEPVHAGVGGELMEPICDFIVGLGDGIIGVLHKVILGQDITIMTINLYDVLNSPFVKIVAAILGGIIIAALLALGAGLIGATFIALGEAIGAGSAAVFVSSFSLGGAISAAIGTIIPLAIGGGVYVGAKVYSADGWRDQQLNLPLYSMSPEEIFSNKIPLFDVNFFNPNEKNEWKYDFAMHLDITDEIKNASYKEIANGNKSVLNEALKEYGTSVDAIIGLNCTDSAEPNTYYYATGDKIIKIHSPTNFVSGIGDGSGTAYLATGIKAQKGNASIPAYNRILSNSVSQWYYKLRIIAIVGMMSVLVYIGIRILISSTSPQKAKYKQLLGDWLIGMVLLFTMHYIMIFSNIFVEKITALLDGINPTMYSAMIQKGKSDKLITELEKYGYTVTEKQEEANGSNIVYLGTDEKDPENKYLEWDTNLMGMLRIQTREVEQEDDNKYIGFSVMFFVMVLYTCIFAWTYIKRVIYLAFLTMIAPMVALTYPIDKANDGKAQGFDFWFKEYIFNLLLQPMHLLIYTVLVSTAVELAITNWVYALVAIGFIAAAEKIVRQMFNFSKANTPGILAGPAGAALTMTGMRWLFGHGPKGGKGSGQSKSSSSGGSTSDEAGITSSGQSKLDIKETMNGLGEGKKDDNSGPMYWNNDAQDAYLDGMTDEEYSEVLRSRGYDDVAIAEEMQKKPWETPTYWNNDKANQYLEGMDYNDSEKAEILRGLGYDETAISEKLSENKKIGGFRRAFSDTASAFGTGIREKFSRSLKDAQPVRALGRLSAGVAGAATFGTLGIAAGVASGDAKNVAQYGAAASAGGYKLGTGTYDSANSAVSVDGLEEVYQRAKMGEQKYKEMVAKRNQMQKAHQESTIRRIQEKENVSRKEAIKKAEDYAQKYMEQKINDVDDWIAIEKMQKQKVQKANGQTENRNYSPEEAVAAYKIHKRAGVDSKDKKKAIEKIQADWNLKDENTAETYYRTAKVFDDIKNG